MESSEATPFKRTLPVEFTGKGFEYFKIWIVNLCLSVVTLGIYSAWAKVRRISYFYGNTRIDGHSFSYLAEPIKILKGRIIAVFFLFVYVISWDFFPDFAIIILAIGLLMLPFIIVAATSFQIRNSAYRNIRFHFRSDYREAYRIMIVPIGIVFLLTWISYEVIDRFVIENIELEEGQSITPADFIPTIFFLLILPLIPYLDYVRTKFIILHAQYGDRRTEFSAGAGGFYGIYIIFVLLMIGISILFGFIIVAIVSMSVVGNEEVQAEAVNASAAAMVPALFIMYGALLFFSGYFRAARTNLVHGSTSFGEININSSLQFKGVGWIYLSNTLAIIFSLGLMIPWAQVRMARYVASRTEIESRDLGNITASSHEETNALGEEIVDAFDLDLGL